MPNWCWWAGGFKFEILKDRIKKLPLIDPNKVDSLYSTIEEKCCNPHDDEFDKWWWIIEFVWANYMFCLNLICILHWTTIRWRIFIFFPTFILMNIFWIKYFNWIKLI